MVPLPGKEWVFSPPRVCPGEPSWSLLPSFLASSPSALLSQAFVLSPSITKPPEILRIASPVIKLDHSALAGASGWNHKAAAAHRGLLLCAQKGPSSLLPARQGLPSFLLSSPLPLLFLLFLLSFPLYLPFVHLLFSLSLPPPLFPPPP